MPGGGHDHGDVHAHGPGARLGDDRLITAALAVITAFLVGEFVAALLAHSIALLADAAHLLIDAFALVAALVAARLARRPARGTMTFGLARAEILSAAVNGATLAVLAAVLFGEAIARLVHPTGVSGATVVAVAAVGLVVNLIAAMLLSRAERGSLNVAGAIAHVATDAVGFGATLVAGILIVTAGWRWADSAATLVIVVVLALAAGRLLQASGRILLEGAPPGVDLARIREHLIATTHVIDIHDLHVWTPTSRLPALSAHVVVADGCFAENRAPQLLDELQGCLAGHFDVEHSTFQIEAAGHVEHEFGTHA